MLAVGTTSGAIALEYVEKAEKEGRSPATIAKLYWVRQWLEPAIGRRLVDQIEPHESLAVLKRQEGKSQFETARRTRALTSASPARRVGRPASMLEAGFFRLRPSPMGGDRRPGRMEARRDYLSGLDRASQT